MRHLFSIGLVVSLSFLIFVTTFCLLFGFYRPPAGPEMPKYPTRSMQYDQNGAMLPQSQVAQRNYDDQYADYQQVRENYTSEKLAPYIRNVLMIGTFIVIVYITVGMLLFRFSSQLIGTVYLFAAVWTVIIGPFAGTAMASVGTRAEGADVITSVLQGVGLVGILGVIALTILGLFLADHKKITDVRVATPQT